jgi:ankyrin repeat protein
MGKSNQYLCTAKKMHIDTYIKNMIYYARSENEYMFYWLKKNTNEINRKQTEAIFKCMNVVDRKSQLVLYKNDEYFNEYVKKKISLHFIENATLSFIQLFIHQGGDINHQWENGNTLLHFLVNRKQVHKKNDVEEELAAYDKQESDNKSQSATIAFLLNQPNINVNIKNTEGKTPLHLIISNKTQCDYGGKLCHFCDVNVRCQLRDMERFLDHPKILVNLQDNEGNTPLHVAVTSAHASIELLMNKTKSNFNIQNNNGNTVLHMIKSPNICKCWLEKNGIQVNIKNDKGETPLHCSIKYPALMSIPEGFCPFWCQARDLLEDSKVDFTCKTKKDKTVLYYAAKYSVDVLRILVEKLNVDVKTIIDDEGRTALHIASKYCNGDVVEYLLDKMSVDDINKLDKNGYSAFEYTVMGLGKKNNKRWKYFNRGWIWDKDDTIFTFCLKFCRKPELAKTFPVALRGDVAVEKCLNEAFKWGDKTAEDIIKKMDYRILDYISFLFRYKKTEIYRYLMVVAAVGVSAFLLEFFEIYF